MGSDTQVKSNTGMNISSKKLKKLGEKHAIMLINPLQTSHKSSWF
jgi:hypothetical protein